MSRKRTDATRRDFALAVAAVPLAAAGAGAAEKPAAPAEEAMLAVIRARYGKHLGEAQLEAVRRGIARNFARAEEVRKVPLRNGDDPALAFRADLP